MVFRACFNPVNILLLLAFNILMTSQLSAQASTGYFSSFMARNGQLAGEDFGDEILCDDDQHIFIAAPYRTLKSKSLAGAVDRLIFAPDRRVKFQLDSPSVGDRFGHGLAWIDDYDGDGRSEIAVGAPGADTVYFMKPSGAIITSFSEVSGSFFGQKIEFLSPITFNALGPEDSYVITAPEHAGGDGAVYIYKHGTGAASSPMKFKEAFHPGSQEKLGWSLAKIHDVNSDGILDFVAGAPKQLDGFSSEAGGIYVFGVDAVGGTIIEIKNILDVADGLAFGYSLANLGDIDGDSVPDIFVGAPNLSAGGAPIGQPSGKFIVYSGATLTSSPAVLCEIIGPSSTVTTAQGRFASAITALKSLDSDSLPEFAVGSPGLNNGTGEVDIIKYVGGSPSSACVRIASYKGSSANEHFGRSLSANKCDLNIDGRQDLLVGSLENLAGTVHLFTGLSGVPTIEAGGIDPGGALLPDQVDFKFRMAANGDFRANIDFNRDPIKACSLSVYARVTVGTKVSDLYLVGTGLADLQNINETTSNMPRVEKINGEAPVLHMGLEVICPNSIFYSNVFARYMNCGVAAVGVTPERWLKLLANSIGTNAPAALKAERVKRRLMRQQRRVLKRLRRGHS